MFSSSPTFHYSRHIMSPMINACKTYKHAGSPKLICGGKLEWVVASCSNTAWIRILFSAKDNLVDDEYSGIIDYCSVRVGHIINIYASTQMSMGQLQTLLVFKYYSCPSLDKPPFSFDLWCLEFKHKMASSCFELCFSCRGCRINKWCDKAPSIGQEKRVRSTLVLAGKHLIATIHLISNTFDRFVVSALILS